MQAASESSTTRTGTSSKDTPENDSNEILTQVLRFWGLLPLAFCGAASILGSCFGE